jgi:uncharacterized membrane protein YgcG
VPSASDAARVPPPILDGDIPEPGDAPRGAPDFDWLTELAIPAGVFGLLGSLLYYLVEVRAALAGPQSIGPLRWVIFWFLLAIIAIARIRTKYGGAAIAGYYTALLGGAMFLFVWVYSGRLGAMYGGDGGDGSLALIFNFALVGLVWWAATAVTREATLEENVEIQLEGGLWSLLADEWQYPDGEEPPDEAVDQAKVRPRHPGRLVLWVSLAALALFAIGQRTIGSEGAHGRAAFWCMSLYVLFALLLLALTNLSALRMSVRRRGISLSPAVTPAWIVASAILVAAIVIFAAIMPREVTEARERRALHLQEIARDSQRPGPHEGPAQGMGRRGEQSGGREEGGTGPGEDDADAPDEQSGDEKRGAGDSSEDTEDESGSGGGTSAGHEGAGEGEGQGGSGEGESSARGDAQSERTLPPRTEGLARILLWVLAALAAVAVIVFLIAHRAHVMRVLGWLFALPARVAVVIGRAIQRLLALLSGFGLGRSGRSGPDGLPENPFVDIFARGLADDLQPAEVVDYVYRAFQVYMGRQGHERGDDQTALEFLRSLPKHVLLPDRAAERLTRAYVLASYSPREVTQAQVAGARETWQVMRDLLAETPVTPR